MKAHARKRARTAAVVAVAGAVLAQLGMAVALETVRPEWRDPEFGWRFKAVRKMDGPLVLALGSSRTQMGLSPHDLGVASPVVYNFGQSGGGPVHHLLNLRRLLDTGVTPRAVLVEVMASVFNQPGPAEHVLRDTTSRLSLADIDRLSPYCDEADALRGRWLTHRALPWHTSRLLLVSHAMPSLLPWQHRVDFQWRQMDDRGWAPFPFEPITPADHARLTARTRTEYAAAFRNYAVAPLPDRATRDLLALCRERNVPVALYRMPEATSFRDLYPPEATAAFAEYLDTLTREFGVPVFDATTWLPDVAFSDGHHQLKSAAKRFSARFGRDCLIPWLASCKLTPDS
jgi:hypothetical protein